MVMIVELVSKFFFSPGERSSKIDGNNKGGYKLWRIMFVKNC